MRNLWKRMPHPQDDQAVDAWAKEGLRVSVPEGSFERVWTGYSRLDRSRGPVPRELELAVRRPRTWTRALAGGLAVVTVILVIVRQFDALPLRPDVTARRIQAVRTAFAIRGVARADADSSRHARRPEAESSLVRRIRSIAAMFDFGASMREFWADPTTFTRRMREIGPVERQIQAFRRAIGIAYSNPSKNYRGGVPCAS